MMTQQQVADLMEKIFTECWTTRQAGQAEYAHTSSNALRNFEQTGSELGISREQVWYIFAKKHWDGILAYINGHRSQREDVRGRIKDLIVYLVLFQAMVEDFEQLEQQNAEATRAQLRRVATPQEIVSQMLQVPPTQGRTI